jgi:hypothetical protein
MSKHDGKATLDREAVTTPLNEWMPDDAIRIGDPFSAGANGHPYPIYAQPRSAGALREVGQRPSRNFTSTGARR